MNFLMNKLKDGMEWCWDNGRGIVMMLISVVLLASMIICVLVNSGVAEHMATHSVSIYIANSVWFSVIAFCSCKYLRWNNKPVTKKRVSNGKFSAPKSVVKK